MNNALLSAFISAGRCAGSGRGETGAVRCIARCAVAGSGRVDIGGGFPETCATELEANVTLRAQIKQAIEAGMPAYAECGGLDVSVAQHRLPGPYLSDGRRDPRRCEDAHQAHRSRLRASQGRRGASVAAPDAPAKQIKAHEFHYSSLENLPSDSRFAYHVERGYGIDGNGTGLSCTTCWRHYSPAHHRQLLLGDPLCRLHPAAQRNNITNQPYQRENSL